MCVSLHQKLLQAFGVRQSTLIKTENILKDRHSKKILQDSTHQNENFHLYHDSYKRALNSSGDSHLDVIL